MENIEVRERISSRSVLNDSLKNNLVDQDSKSTKPKKSSKELKDFDSSKHSEAKNNATFNSQSPTSGAQIKKSREKADYKNETTSTGSKADESVVESSHQKAQHAEHTYAPLNNTKCNKLREEFKEQLKKDKPFQALISWFEFEETLTRNMLICLTVKCHRENGRGFKDANTLQKFIHQLEDGKSLDQIVIQETDLAQPDAIKSKSSSTSANKSSRIHIESKTLTSTSESAQQASKTASSSKIQKKKAEFTCKVCLDEPVSVTFVPCGHLVACVSCASAIFDCPVCRAPIRGTIKTFF